MPSLYGDLLTKGVQHRFGGMRDGAQNRGGMRNTRNSEGGIRDENILAGSGCAHSIGWMRDSSEIDSGMRDLSSELPFENLTSGIGIEILKVVDCGMKPKLVSGCGIRKAYFGPSRNPLNNFMIRLREGWLRIMSPE